MPGSEARDATFTETREEIERVRDEDASFFEEAGEATGVLSGEEYRQELREALENPELAAALRALPGAQGSGMARDGRRARLRLLRAGRRPPRSAVPLRRVGATATSRRSSRRRSPVLPTPGPTRAPDTVACSRTSLSRCAYDAWALAKADIVERWNESSDPLALAPEVPKAMRDAADLVRTTPPPAGHAEQADALVDRLEDAYPERIQRQIRDAMRSSEDPIEQAAAIAAGRELGLEPSPPPEPLPVITEDDVHLVCWLAIDPVDTE